MRVILVLCFVCFTSCTGMIFNSISVKYDLTFDGYWSLPRRASNDRGFQFVETDKELNVNLYSFPNDPRFFVLYDTYGNIAGLRTGYIKEDLPKKAEEKGLSFPYKFSSHKHFESGRYWDTDIWYTTVLFVDPAVLKAGGRKNPGIVIADDVYLKLEGKWTKMPRDQCAAEPLGFVKQGCFPGMGMHYFYKTNSDMKCKDFPGVFLLYEREQLMGFGLIPFGSFTSGPQRTWLEDLPVSAIKITIPNRPECFTSWMEKYGTSALHVFFRPLPRTTLCHFPFQPLSPCKDAITRLTSSISGLLKFKSANTKAQHSEENLNPDTQAANTLTPKEGV